MYSINMFLCIVTWCSVRTRGTRSLSAPSTIQTLRAVAQNTIAASLLRADALKTSVSTRQPTGCLRAHLLLQHHPCSGVLVILLSRWSRQNIEMGTRAAPPTRRSASASGRRRARARGGGRRSSRAATGGGGCRPDRAVGSTNLQNKGRASADRGNRATLPRTAPRFLFKSSARDSSRGVRKL